MEQQKCTSRTILPFDVILLQALQYGPRRFGGFGSKVVEGRVTLNNAPCHRRHRAAWVPAACAPAQLQEALPILQALAARALPHPVQT